MVGISEKILEETKSKLIKGAEKWDKGVCGGMVLDARNGDLLELSHTACHSWVNYAYNEHCFEAPRYSMKWDYPYKKDAKNLLVLNYHNNKAYATDLVTSGASDFLIMWAARESPFSEFVLNRDDTDSILKGGLILFCGPDGLRITEAMWLLKVIRFLTEGGGAANTFMHLVKGGVDPMLAIYVASYVRLVKGATFGFTGLEGHSTVIRSGGTDLVGMIQRNYNKESEDTRTLFVTNKKTLPKGFNSAKFLENNKKIEGFCKPVLKSDGWGGVIQCNSSSAEDFLKKVLEWQKEFSNILPPKEVAELSANHPDNTTIFLDMDL